MKQITTLLALLLCACLEYVYGQSATKPVATQVQPYVNVLRKHGLAPIAYVQQKLATHDLLIFDDAMHYLVEPWVLYMQLLDDPNIRAQVQYVFIESMPQNAQPLIDSLMAAPELDSLLLAQIFTYSYEPKAWPYAIHYQFIAYMHRLNRGLPKEKRIHVVAVSNPVYWEGLHQPADVQTFRAGLLDRDHFMYALIKAYMKDFTQGKKGFFFTNTRHAYTGVRNKKNELFWNTATYFRQLHPGKSWSLRYNAPMLHIYHLRTDKTGTGSASGEDRFDYKLERIAGGLWDSARSAYSKPVAIDLANNAFGQAAYVGNHMLQAKPGQTLADAYDAILLDVPLEQQHRSAYTSIAYTPVFMQEMQRRMHATHGTAALLEMARAAGYAQIADYVLSQTQPEPERSIVPILHIRPLAEAAQSWQ